MENKKYLDKVVNHLVSGTKIDYDNEEVIYPFLPANQYLLLTTYNSSLFFFLSKYCKNHFGLTKEETEYVSREFRSIIKDKITR